MTDDLKERLLDESVTGFNLTIAAVEAAERIEQLEDALATSRELKQIWRNRAYKIEKNLAAAQAKIDALMLEYCPEEMTPEQIAKWERYQKKD